jgi:hypothetical protein
MRVPLLNLAAYAAVFSAWPCPPAAWAGDGIAVQMRVEGTVPKPDSPLFNKNPYAKDRVPYAWLPHQFPEGELYVEVAQGKERAVVVMSLGRDKKLKEQADQLVGKRVVVECRGEYQLHAGKVTTNIGRGPEEYATVTATVKLTVVKIRPAD